MGSDGVFSERRLQQLIDREDTGFPEMELPDGEGAMPGSGLTCGRCGKPKSEDEMFHNRWGMTKTCRDCLSKAHRGARVKREVDAPKVPRKTLRQATLCCPHCGKTLFDLKV